MAVAQDSALRVVSINLCTDQLLLAFADRDQIASLSFLATDPDVSNFAVAAQGLPRNRGRAEEVLAAQPDLVLAGTATTRSTVALLQRLGIRVELFPLVDSLDEARRQMRQVAELIGHAARGEEAIVALDQRIQQVRNANASPSALVYGGRGFTHGRDSLIDDLLQATGFRNAAADAGITGFGMMPLELVVAMRPKVLILGAEYVATPSLAREFLDHPALAGVAEQTHRLTIPARLWTCGGPWLVEAIDRLARFRAILAPSARS